MDCTKWATAGIVILSLGFIGEAGSQVIDSEAPELARLSLRWTSGNLEVLKLSLSGERSEWPKADAVAGDALELISDGEVMATVALRIPNRLYHCLPDPASGELAGGSIPLESVEFSVAIPWSDRLSDLHWIDSDGNSKGLFDLKSLEKQTIKATWPSTRIIGNGADSDRLVIAVLAEGYQAQEIGQFQSDALAALSGFLSEPPWADYASLINVYAVDVVSAESGADHPNDGISVDTALDATYGLPPLERLLTVNFSKAFAAALSVPSFDLVLVIVNDSEYGGSGGPIGVISTHAAAVDLALHELGHTFGNLADEYDTACPGCPTATPEANVTDETVFGAIPWSIWIDTNPPLPTPEEPQYGGIVGLFEGAKYQPTGVYRPQLSCMMRSLNEDFCAVCSETHVLEIYSIPGIDPILSASPDPSQPVEYAPGSSTILSVEVVQPAMHSLSVSWYLDGQSIAGETGTSLELDTSVLAGGHTLSAVVIDDTGYVRSDPGGLLQDSVAWSLVEGEVGPDLVDFGFPTFHEEGDLLEMTVPDPFDESKMVQWSKDGQDLVDGGRISGAQGRTFSIFPLVIADSGIYGVSYDTGAKAVVSKPSIAIVVVPAGSLPAVGATGLGILLGGIVVVGGFLVWRRFSKGAG